MTKKVLKPTVRKPPKKDVVVATEYKDENFVSEGMLKAISQQDIARALVAINDRERQMYRPSRLEYFVAVAMTGLIACPDTFETEAGTSVTDNALALAMAMIEKIDAQKAPSKK